MHEPCRTSIRQSAPATRVVAIPASDLDFVRFVRDAGLADRDPAALEARIRTRYPRARVHANDLSGRDAVLYAYRDGRWEPSRPA